MVAVGFALAASLAAALALSGCFGIEGEPLVAATVNGEEILESEVTDYIEGFRSENADYDTDEGWAAFLTSSGYTAETLRTYVLESVFIPTVLISQECAERSITLTDAVLDEAIDEERAYYEERYGEGSWESVLASYDYDEESWRDNESSRLLEEALKLDVTEEVGATREEVQEEADEGAYVYNGKHSVYLTFDSEEEAAKVATRLQKQKKGVKRRTLARLGYNVTQYAGWSGISAFAENMSSDYIAVLNELSSGEASDPVLLDEETWAVIICDEVFEVEEGGPVDLDEVPALILAEIEADADETVRDAAFEEWMAELTDESDIEVSYMPDSLSYDVNVALAED